MFVKGLCNNYLEGGFGKWVKYALKLSNTPPLIKQKLISTPPHILIILRWLDWIFWWGYLPSLSINYVAMSKDMEKRLPQLYYVKMKISI